MSSDHFKLFSGVLEAAKRGDLPSYVKSHPEAVGSNFVIFLHQLEDRFQRDGDAEGAEAVSRLTSTIKTVRTGLGGSFKVSPLAQAIELQTLKVQRMMLRDLVKSESEKKHEETIKICRALLQEIDPQKFPELIGIVKLRLATTLLVQSGKQDTAALDEGKTLLESVIRVLPSDGYPDELSLAHSNLASAYATPSWDEPEEDTERVIQHGEAALKFGGKNTNPKLHSLLADAYYQRQRGDREENLDSAIRHLNDALAITPSFEEKRDIHSNLAMIYAERIRGGKSANEKQSKHHKKFPAKTG